MEEPEQLSVPGHHLSGYPAACGGLSQVPRLPLLLSPGLRSTGVWWDRLTADVNTTERRGFQQAGVWQDTLEIILQEQ